MDEPDIIDRIRGFLRHIPTPQASYLFGAAIAEIERLRALADRRGEIAVRRRREIERLRGYRDEAESDAAVARLLVDRLRLTDEEREAVETAAMEADAHQHAGRAATLRGLLDRVTEPLPKEKRA